MIVAVILHYLFHRRHLKTILKTVLCYQARLPLLQEVQHTKTVVAVIKLVIDCAYLVVHLQTIPEARLAASVLALLALAIIILLT